MAIQPARESDSTPDSNHPELKNDLLLRAAQGERTERTPVWLMRQAGRFDPQYQQLRANCGLELEDLFREPNMAAKITMLPMRLGVDALILFQDILTLLSPLGTHFVFRPGPILDQPVRTAKQIDALTIYDTDKELDFVPRSIELTLDALEQQMPLLGFAGAPLTLATFMIEGQSPGRNVGHVTTLMRDDPAACHALLEKITQITISYLRMQIQAGVHAVQLFESVGDLFDDKTYEQFAQPYQCQIMAALKGLCPRILFVKENPRIDLMAKTDADVVSVGGCVDLAKAKSHWGTSVALQGNVDNQLLRTGSPDQIEQAVRACISAGGQQGHILNLNHGILKDTPFENVQHFINAAKSTRLPIGEGPLAKVT